MAKISAHEKRQSRAKKAPKSDGEKIFFTIVKWDKF
jgi:hypothetical protein